MSEETHNEGSEEEKNKVGDSHDEDFGLPDLEFEELQELDINLEDEGEAEAEATESQENVESGQEILQGSDDIDMSVLDDIEVPETSEPAAEVTEPDMSSMEPIADTSEAPLDVLDEGIDEVEDILDSAQLISDRLGDEDVEDSGPSTDFGSDINYDDLIGAVAGDESALSDDKPEAELPTELDLQEIPGLTDEEIAALEAMDLEDSAEASEPVDETSYDPLADINSPDELAALGLEDEDPSVNVEDESAMGDSLFGDETADEDVFSPGMEESVGDESAFESGEGSIFESEEISLQGEEKIDFEPPEEPTLPPNYKPYSYDDSSKGNFTKYIVIGAIGFVLIGFVFFWFIDPGEGEGTKKAVANTETPAKKPTTKKPATNTQKASGSTKTTDNATNKSTAASTNKTSQTRKSTSSTAASTKRTQRKVTPAQSANAGEIVQVTDKLGRSYVIVGSFIDQDLAMDYAKVLSSQGNGVKIIHPFGKVKRYRVSIADFGTYADASGQLNTYKSSFGDQVWALKY